MLDVQQLYPELLETISALQMLQIDQMMMLRVKLQHFCLIRLLFQQDAYQTVGRAAITYIHDTHCSSDSEIS